MTVLTKYRVDRILSALAKRHCTALRHATNYRQVFIAGEAEVRTVGSDVMFECPRCLGRRDSRKWNVQLVGAATQAEERIVPSGKYAVDAVVWGND